MATANNTIKTRIQLKSDTEANWNKAGPKDGSNGFVPLSGELIVYTADTTHPFCRLKVGNGVDNVVNLPFIDAGTINGEEVEIVKLAHFSDRPLIGSSDKLYIDLETNTIYHYTTGIGYSQLYNFKYSQIGSVLNWNAGRAAQASVTNNSLKLVNGIEPVLSWENVNVITGIKGE